LVYGLGGGGNNKIQISTKKRLESRFLLKKEEIINDFKIGNPTQMPMYTGFKCFRYIMEKYKFVE
jgi:hypothetical protein